MSALLLGSISVLADTSELQREAFNQAFAEHGLDWEWSRKECRNLLTSNGGRDRVAEYAGGRDETVDAEADPGATGQVSLDFIDGPDGVVRTIECNPRTHSAITLLDGHPDLAPAFQRPVRRPRHPPRRPARAAR